MTISQKGRLAAVLCFVLLLVPFLNNQRVYAAAMVTTYSGPSGIAASDKFQVWVDNNPSFVYQSYNTEPKFSSSLNASYTTFCFSGGSVTVKVKSLSGTITSATILPAKYNITPIINGDELTFTMDSPKYVVVDINGNAPDNRLFIFGDTPETVPSLNDPSYIVLGPGYHYIGQDFEIPDNTTLYIAGGAYVEGTIRTEGKTNVAIKGRGVLSGRPFSKIGYPAMVAIEDSVGVTIEGITIVDEPGWAIDIKTKGWVADRVSGFSTMYDKSPTVYDNIKNVKIIGWLWGCDGIHPGRLTNIDNVFVHTSDDSIKVTEDIQNVNISNATIWQTGGSGAFQLSWSTIWDGGNARILDSDVVHFNSQGWSGFAPVSTNQSAGGFVRDIYVRNLRVDDFYKPGGTPAKKYISMVMSADVIDYNYDPGVHGQYSNIFFDGLHVPSGSTADLRGFDATHQVKDVTFKNVHVGGVLATTLAAAGVSTNSYTSNIVLDNNATNPSLKASPAYEILDDHLKSQFNQNENGMVNYFGSWAYNESQPSAYDNNVTSSATANDYFTIRFEGTRVKWFAKKGPDQGRAAVSIDGGAETTYDLYNASPAWQQQIYDSGVLNAGFHVLKVRVTGQTSGSAATITHDFVQTTGNSPVFRYDGSNGTMPAPKTETRLNKVNDNLAGTWNGSVEYSGTWTDAPTGYYDDVLKFGNYNYDSHMSSTNNSYALLRFNGTRAVWYGMRDNASGKAAVSVDGGPETLVDLYVNVNAVNKFTSMALFDTGILSQGDHTLKVRVTNQKNASSGGYKVYVDRFEYEKSGQPVWEFRDDVDNFLKYSGSGVWTDNTDATVMNKTGHYLYQSGDKASFTFYGTRAIIYGVKDSWYESGNVYVDGTLAATVSQYASTKQPRQVIYDTGVLAKGLHKVEYVPLAANNDIMVDYIAFTRGDSGSAISNLVTNGEFEANGGFVQSPTGWSTWSSNNRADADYAESNTPFVGTYHLTHYKDTTPYGVYTYQTITGLTNGWYTLKAWVRNSGGQTEAWMEAKDYGGVKQTINLPVTSTYSQVTIPNIIVTNGQGVIGFWSDTGATNNWEWITVDSVQFYKQ